MKQTGVWIDGSKAVIITIENNKVNINTLAANIEHRGNLNDDEGDRGSFMGQQHISRENTFKRRERQDVKRYINEVAGQLNHADELYIFGSGEMRMELKKHIEQDSQIKTEMIKAVEPAQDMTENQMVDRVKRFYDIPT